MRPGATACGLSTCNNISHHGDGRERGPTSVHATAHVHGHALTVCAPSTFIGAAAVRSHVHASARKFIFMRALT